MSPRRNINSDGPLDLVIHEASRLTIVSVLNECDVADFNFMLATTGLTRGNLSTHMAKLIAAGYVSEDKQFVDRKPCTRYRLTDAGRKAFEAYRAAWQRITQGTNGAG
ncbi:MAG TPA: transcriptional regulator [Planctomycetaceae bacterium]|nr:transcriptional regulator [Planctomycetaceae bacterium]